MKGKLTLRPASAMVAKVCCVLCGIPILSFQHIAYDRLQTDAKAVMDEVSALFRCADHNKTTIEILLLYLLVGGKSFAESTPNFPVVSPLSLRELSQITGLHRETLRRRMSDAEGLGLVQRISGGYVVADLKRWLQAVRVFRQQG